MKDEADGSSEDDVDDDDDVSTGAFTEIRFVPNDKESCKCFTCRFKMMLFVNIL